MEPLYLVTWGLLLFPWALVAVILAGSCVRKRRSAPRATAAPRSDRP